MKVLSFLNNKGEVGKTTLTCNLAAHLAKMNHRIIVIDADPQCNAAILTLGEDRAAPPNGKKIKAWSVSKQAIFEHYLSPSGGGAAAAGICGNPFARTRRRPAGRWERLWGFAAVAGLGGWA
jgi:cellulose biosynthesis protein BcsQ